MNKKPTLPLPEIDSSTWKGGIAKDILSKAVEAGNVVFADDIANDSPVKPLGHYVLIEIIPVKFVSTGGIVLSSANEQERERKGRDLGKILSFGPTAYKGFEGCDTPEGWGVAVGDVVELKGRYDGKFSSVSDYDKKYESLRYVSDSDIIGIFSKEMVEQLEDKS